jgi:transcription initiation factor IIE alpha subunit
MPIKFTCPNCQTGLEAVDELAGKKGSCPKCGKSLTIPENKPESQAEPKQ